MKNILLISPPFSENLNSILGVAQGLNRIGGFNITIVSTKSVEDKVLSIENVEFKSILDNYEGIFYKVFSPKYFFLKNPIKFIRKIEDIIFVQKLVKEELKELIKLVNPDCVIADSNIAVAGLVCEEFGIKWITTISSPSMYEVYDGVPSYIPGLNPPSDFFDKIKHKIYNKLTRVIKKSVFQFFSKDLKELGFNSLYRQDGSEVIYSNQKTFALGLDDLEFNKPKHYFFEYIGPVFYSAEKKESKNLLSFYSFSKAKKNILITFESKSPSFNQEILEYFSKYCEQNKRHNFHISLNDNNNNVVEKIHNNLIVYSSVPYNKYLKNYDIVIHPGSSNIMYECIRNEKPSIVFPQDGEQFNNATRIEFANLGVRIKKLKELDAALDNIIIMNNYEYFTRQYYKQVMMSNSIGKIVDEINGKKLNLSLQNL
jgi:UDP:flavonoid glycosyltransferase YjiC (YdhE family)